MCQHKDVYIIDFTNVKHYLEIHLIIKEALGFPDYYGCSWSAFWDCLTDMYGEPINIEIVGLEVIERKFGDAASKMIEILRRFKHYEPFFASDIRIEVIRGDERIFIT